MKFLLLPPRHIIVIAHTNATYTLGLNSIQINSKVVLVFTPRPPSKSHGLSHSNWSTYKQEGPGGIWMNLH